MCLELTSKRAKAGCDNVRSSGGSEFQSEGAVPANDLSEGGGTE